MRVVLVARCGSHRRASLIVGGIYSPPGVRQRCRCDVSATARTARLWKKSSSRSVVMLPECTGKAAWPAASIGIPIHAATTNVRRVPVGHDHQVIHVARQGVGRRLVDPRRHLQARFGAIDPLVGTQPVAYRRWRDEPFAQPGLLASFRHAVRLLLQSTAEVGCDVQDVADHCRRLRRPAKTRGDQGPAGSDADPLGQSCGDPTGVVEAFRRQLGVERATDQPVDVVRRQEDAARGESSQ